MMRYFFVFLSLCTLSVTAFTIHHACADETRSAAELSLSAEWKKNQEVEKLPIPELEHRMAAGDLKAQAELAARYGRGDGVTKDIPKALELLRIAAGKNDANAQYYLGVVYLSGTGVTKDEKQARLLFELAAGQGLPPAEYILASMLYNGKGGKPDPQAGFWNYWDAASKGYAPAEFVVGNLYDMGAGVERNPRAAAYWYRRSLSRAKDANIETWLLKLIERGEVAREPGDPEQPAAVANIVPQN